MPESRAEQRSSEDQEPNASEERADLLAEPPSRFRLTSDQAAKHRAGNECSDEARPSQGNGQAIGERSSDLSKSEPGC